MTLPAAQRLGVCVGQAAMLKMLYGLPCAEDVHGGGIPPLVQ